MFTKIKRPQTHAQNPFARDMEGSEAPLARLQVRNLKIRSDIQFSGSVGGHTYGHNLGGQYIRARSVPVNPNSERQGEVRSYLGSWASAWSTVLTQTQRDAWRTYAQNNTHLDAFGDPIKLPAHCWYIMFNSRLEDAGESAITDPPVAQGPVGFTTFVGTLSAPGTLSVAFTPVLESGNLIQLWQTLPGSLGTSPNFNQARLVGYSAVDETTPWAATLPFPIPSGMRGVFFGSVMDPEGQVSARMTDIVDSP